MPNATCVIAHPDSGAAVGLAETARAAGLTVLGTADSRRGLRGLILDARPRIAFLHALMPGVCADEADDWLDSLPVSRRPAAVFLVPQSLSAAQKAVLCPVSGFTAAQTAEFRGLFPCIPLLPTPEEMKTACAAALPLPVREAGLARAEALLSRMGVRNAPARRYLAYAVGLSLDDADAARSLSGYVLPEIARAFGVPPRRAEDAMRRAVDRAWTTGNIEAQYAFFGNTINAEKGKPTLSALIATAAEALRLSSAADEREEIGDVQPLKTRGL